MGTAVRVTRRGDQQESQKCEQETQHSSLRLGGPDIYALNDYQFRRPLSFETWWMGSARPEAYGVTVNGAAMPAA